MNYPKRLLALATLIICLLPHFLEAQEEELVKAEIVTLSWKGKISELWFQTKDGTQKMDVYERGFTSPVEYTGPAAIAFYDEITAFDFPPDKRPQPVAVAKLPPAGGQVLLIFAEKPGQEKSWTVQVIDNSARSLPPGGYQVINLTKVPYVAAFDKSIIPVKASGITLIRPTKGKDTRDMSVRFARGNELVYSSIWGHQENRRGTIFLLPQNPGGKFISIRRYFQPVLERKAGTN